LERVSEAGGGGTRGGESFGLWSVDSLVVLDLSAATYLPYILPTTFCIHSLFCCTHFLYINLHIYVLVWRTHGGRGRLDCGQCKKKNSKSKPSAGYFRCLFVRIFLTSFYST
jgi:hypothetical protein